MSNFVHVSSFMFEGKRLTYCLLCLHDLYACTFYVGHAVDHWTFISWTEECICKSVTLMNMSDLFLSRIIIFALHPCCKNLDISGLYIMWSRSWLSDSIEKNVLITEDRHVPYFRCLGYTFYLCQLILWGTTYWSACSYCWSRAATLLWNVQERLV